MHPFNGINKGVAEGVCRPRDLVCQEKVEDVVIIIIIIINNNNINNNNNSCIQYQLKMTDENSKHCLVSNLNCLSFFLK